MLSEQLRVKEFISYPGCPLLVAYINSKANYEDSVIISQEVNDLGLFEHFSYLNYPVPMYVLTLKTGTVLSRKDAWFRPIDEGTVMYEGSSKSLVRYARVSMHSKVVRVGDKIDGQKFTISEIRVKNDMPKLKCNITGKIFYPHILVACSSIHNRGTLGQIYEGSTHQSLIRLSSSVIVQ
jgi:DNA-directed RNA polymerase beta subunit